MPREIKYRVPVICQNGHKSYWFYKLNGLETSQSILSATEYNKKCQCPKSAIDEGWKQDGDEELYTGLKDKNRKEIYDGDIIVFKNIDNSIKELILPVIWEEESCGFVCKDNFNSRGVDMANGYDTISGQVIGNIYENPELL